MKLLCIVLALCSPRFASDLFLIVFQFDATFSVSDFISRPTSLVSEMESDLTISIPFPKHDIYEQFS